MKIGHREFRDYPKIVVGEGPSDCNFLLKFCEKHNLNGFQFLHTSLFEEGTGGWEHFDKIFKNLPKLARFELVTDIVVFCDTGDDPAKRFGDLKSSVEAVNTKGPQGNITFAVGQPNSIIATGTPRVHVYMVPKTDEKGGLESLCLAAAAKVFGDSESATMQAVDDFASKVCKLADGKPWTVEKTDKLRLHSYVAATSPRRPGVHFYRQLSMTDGTVPLDSDIFDGIKAFLSDVAAL